MHGRKTWAKVESSPFHSANFYSVQVENFARAPRNTHAIFNAGITLRHKARNHLRGTLPFVKVIAPWMQRKSLSDCIVNIIQTAALNAMVIENKIPTQA